MDDLRDHLKKAAKGPNHRFRQHVANMPLWYAVAFPSGGWPDGVEKPGDCDVYDHTVTREPELLCRKLKELAYRLPGRMRGSQGLDSTTIDFVRQVLKPTIDFVRQVLKPDFRMEDHSWTLSFKDSLKEIVELTDKQSTVLRLARRNDRVLLEGGAGTGKTMLAVKLACERAKQGDRVALLCDHKKLAPLLKKETRHHGNNMVAEYLYGLFVWVLRDSPVSRNAELMRQMIFHQQRLAPARQWHQLEEKVAELAWKALVNVPPQFDYLIIDEFHSFDSPVFFDVLDRVLANGLAGGKWAIFADFSNQSFRSTASLTDNSSHMKAREALEAMSSHWVNDVLEENCRNTRNIFDRMQAFKNPDSPYQIRPGASNGTQVRARTYSDLPNLALLLDEEITRLCQKGVRREQIVVLTDTRPEWSVGPQNMVIRRFGPHSWQLVDISDDDHIVAEEGISVCGVSAFRGLESDVIIYVCGLNREARELEGAQEEVFRPLRYLALGRAKAELSILVPEDNPEELKTLLGVEAAN